MALRHAKAGDAASLRLPRDNLKDTKTAHIINAGRFAAIHLVAQADNRSRSRERTQ